MYTWSSVHAQCCLRLCRHETCIYTVTCILHLFVQVTFIFLFSCSVCGLGSHKTWLPEGRRLTRGNPRLVARNALSSSTQAQILTAATFTSGVQLKIDGGGEEGERKLPANVQAALRNVISHHPSTAPRTSIKPLTRTLGCQTDSVNGVELTTTAMQTEQEKEEVEIEKEMEVEMDTQEELAVKSSIVPRETMSTSSPTVSRDQAVSSSSMQSFSPQEVHVSTQAVSTLHTEGELQNLLICKTSPAPSQSSVSPSPSLNPPSTKVPSLMQPISSSPCLSFTLNHGTDCIPESASLISSPRPFSSPSPCPSPSPCSSLLSPQPPLLGSPSSFPVSSLTPHPSIPLESQIAHEEPSHSLIAQPFTEPVSPMDECTEILKGTLNEKEEEKTEETSCSSSTEPSISSPASLASSPVSIKDCPRKSVSSSMLPVSVASQQPHLPALTLPLSAPSPLSSELTPEMEESEMMAAVASQLGLDSLDSSLLNVADLISLLEPTTAAAFSVIQPPLPTEDPPLSPPPPPPLDLPSLPRPNISSSPISSPFTPHPPNLPPLLPHALPSPQQLQEAISLSSCDESFAFDEQILLRELPADLQETVQAILDGSTDTIQ